MGYMKILIISMETWKNDTNGGNVLSNIFKGFKAEFAQIYCSTGYPDNNICKNYFQITDAMAIQNILHRTPMGREFYIGESDDNTSLSVDEKISNIKKTGSFEFLRVAREIVWSLSNYKNSDLQKFVTDFNPDVIFAPCYGATYMLSITRYVFEITGKPIISYISDDFYSLRQCRFSPIFWINRFAVRRSVKKTWKSYSLIYTMTSEQLKLMSKLGRPMKILCKSGKFDKNTANKGINKPIRFIYAGGLYLNRWKVLVALVNAMKMINQDGVKMILDIYTGTTLRKKAYSILNDGITSRVHSPISFKNLMEEYEKSDVALHVESFDIKNRLNVRMSFSTKIIDCLDSGCAVMAICDKKQGGFQYLKKNDAALCISRSKDIEPMLRSIVKNPEIIQEYRRKALECGKRNHLQEKIAAGIRKDFEIISTGGVI